MREGQRLKPGEVARIHESAALRVGYKLTQAVRESQELRERIATFEAASGVKIESYPGPAQLGALVRMLRRPWGDPVKRLLQTLEDLRELEEARAAARELLAELDHS